MNGKRNGKKVTKPTGPVACLTARIVRSVTQHLSEIVRESLKQPGSWRCIELVYRNEPQKILDYFFFNNRSARGARNRLRILQEEICKCVEQHSRISNPVKLISVGSGPGHEILGSLERFQGKLNAEATCIDKDPSALEYGRSLAVEKGLDSSIRYVQGNVLRMDFVTTEYDIAILSGLIDYFDFETVLSVLKMVREQLIPSGTILIANMRRHYLASTMSILGDWNLVYREPQDVENILTASGYEGIEVWLEPEEIFCIGKARRPR